MSKSVWKFPIGWEDVQTITLPKGAVVLHAGEQSGKPFIWALIDPQEKEQDTRTLRLAETGDPIYQVSKLEYIGTVQSNYQGHVWHVFEILKGQSNEKQN